MLQVQSIAATRTTTPASETAYVATPLSFVMTLAGSDTLDGHDALWLELHQCREDHEAGELPLAYTTVNSPTGTSETLSFTSAQLNRTFTPEKQEFWVVIYATGPEDNLQPIYECSLTLRNVHVSLRTELPDPPDAATALTQAVADTLYAPIGGGAGVTFITAPLASLSDTRGALGNFCYDATTGILYQKMSISPHAWVGWQTFNEV